jgi:hypothetical protein
VPPVDAAGHARIRLALNPIPHHQIRIFFGLHFAKTFCRQFASHRAANAIVEQVGIQLQPDVLFDSADIGKSFKLRKSTLGLKSVAIFAAADSVHSERNKNVVNT